MDAAWLPSYIGEDRAPTTALHCDVPGYFAGGGRVRISKDKQYATIELQGTYAAPELEMLIAELSALRAEMAPAVPLAPPTTNGTEDPGVARARGDPCVQVAVMRNGLTRFWVRHGGLGWFAFNLPVERAHMLAQYILGLTTQREQAQEFFGRKRRESDVSH
jgi:hypothetical protein